MATVVKSFAIQGVDGYTVNLRYLQAFFLRHFWENR